MGGLNPLIETRDLTVGHGGVALLRGVNLTLGAGQVLSILGPNGVGKTTLFRTILGLAPAISGTVWLGARALAGMRRAEVAAHLAHVPQALHSPFAYTALDIVLMGAAAHLGPFARPGVPEADRAHAAMDLLGIGNLAPRDITRLSGGQRQLVLIARALAQNARAVLMDEPTASLDFVNRRMVDGAVHALAAAGIGVILSTHDPDQAAALGDTALLLGRDGVVAQGAVGKAITAATLSVLYGTPIHSTARPDGRSHFY